MILKNSEQKKINGPEAIANILQDILFNENEIDQDKEHFWVIGLNSANRIKYIELASLGILNRSLVHPREVFRYAIMNGIYFLIIAHNHPSNLLAPSDDDLEVTDRLKKAGSILDIDVIDHVIITNQRTYFSFKENGLI
jgi:DNA repair protein RadC